MVSSHTPTSKLQTIRKSIWLRRWRIALIGALCLVLLGLPMVVTRFETAQFRYGYTNMYKAPHRTTGIVFGAGISANGQPSEYLRNRVATGVQLLKSGQVDELLMSGDNSRKGYDEPTAMKQYAIKLGADSAKIRLDYAGFNTYNTCYRADHVFRVHSAALVSQSYHLPRAVLTCRGFGINAIGVAAQKQGRDWTVSYIAREAFSTIKAYIELVIKPKAVFSS